MAVTRVKFEGSDAKIACWLKEASLSNKKSNSNPAVKEVLRHFTADCLKNGHTATLLDDVLVKAISNLQNTNQAMKSVEPQSESALVKQTEEFNSRCIVLSKALKEAQQASDREEREYYERLQKAPNPEEYLRNFPQPLTAIDQRSEKLNKEVIKLLTDIQDMQEKTEDRYKITYAKIHGRNPAAIEKKQIPVINSSSYKTPGL